MASKSSMDGDGSLHTSKTPARAARSHGQSLTHDGPQSQKLRDPITLVPTIETESEQESCDISAKSDAVSFKSLQSLIDGSLTI
jgi:hypothetical protein